MNTFIRLNVSDVTTLHDEALTILIALHAWAESLEDQTLNLELWRLLRAHSERHKYFSYLLNDRRTNKVSDYQYNAPGEWFAETYAIHYLGKLSNTHPMYPILMESDYGQHH